MVCTFIASVFHGAVLRLRARNKPALKQYQLSTLALKYPLTAVTVIVKNLPRRNRLDSTPEFAQPAIFSDGF